MIETLSLSIVTPVVYVLGLLITMRSIAWNAARDYYRLQRHTCDCKLKLRQQPPWESPADAFHRALHTCDWAPTTIAGILWPVTLVVYALWKPAHWIVAHEPREKLTSAERVARAEKELAAATAAIDADDVDDDGCGSYGYGHR